MSSVTLREVLRRWIYRPFIDISATFDFIVMLMSDIIQIPSGARNDLVQIVVFIYEAAVTVMSFFLYLIDITCIS